MNLNPYDVMFLGLSFDIAGGIALASGFMLKRLNDVFRESSTVFGYNRALVRSALQQHADAWTGAILLAFGFLLQMYAYFHGGLSTRTFGLIDSVWRLATAGAVVVAPVSVILFVISRRVSARALRGFDDQVRNPSAAAIVSTPGNSARLDIIAAELGASRIGHETEAEFAARLTAIRAEKAARATNKQSTTTR